MKSLIYWLPREVEAVVVYVEIQPYWNRDPVYSLTFYPSVVKTLMVLYGPPTQREMEVLVWVALGYANWEIADLLVIAESTVESFCGNIFDKLGVTDRTEAATWAIVNGLITVKIQDHQDT